MRLALFLSGLSGGGAQRRMLALARGFAARGHDVDFVVARGDGPFRAQVTAPVTLVPLASWPARLPVVGSRRPLWVLAAVPALARYLRRRRPDVLLSTSNAANLAALSLRALSRAPVPVVASVNIHLSAATAGMAPPWRFVTRLLMGRLYASADALVAISRGVTADLAALGVPAERIATIHNPLDIEAAQRQAATPPKLPWPQSDGTPIILAVGKLKPQKDFPTLLRAFARVRAERPARLAILGEGEERERLRALARDLGVAGELVMPGFVANPFAWMARASVFVLSSAWEGLSNALLEALACGCPVVSTDCPSGPREILLDGAYGPLVPPGDDGALAAAIVRVLRAPPERDRLRARAATFSIDSAADRYLDVLLRVTPGMLPGQGLSAPGSDSGRYAAPVATGPGKKIHRPAQGGPP